MLTVAFDPLFLVHDPGPAHPESVQRARAVQAWLTTRDDVHEVPGRDATRTELCAAHDEAYLDTLERARGKRLALDPDTATSAGSVQAAIRAAGTTIELCCRVADEEAAPGLALVRPPGHHAVRERAMGFCLINNVAVAARALQASGRAERIAILDWDVHHGNGTESIFWEDPSVMYLSVHQSPLYPGTGAETDVGGGRGRGTTVNVPVRPGAGDAELLRASVERLEPAVRAFQPDMILVSAGYDGLREDPLASLEYTTDGIGELSKRWRDLAHERCGGRLAGVLEGGYHLGGLRKGIEATLRAWSGDSVI
ncbi:MAG: histone deacetylase family protein [Myxococcota bacterium]